MLNDIVLDIPADLQSMPTYSSANNSSQTLPFNSSSNILYNAHLKELKEGSQLLNQINGITSRVSALRCDLFIEEKRKRNRKVVEKLTKKLHELVTTIETLLFIITDLLCFSGSGTGTLLTTSKVFVSRKEQSKQILYLFSILGI